MTSNYGSPFRYTGVTNFDSIILPEDQGTFASDGNVYIGSVNKASGTAADVILSDGDMTFYPNATGVTTLHGATPIASGSISLVAGDYTQNVSHGASITLGSSTATTGGSITVRAGNGDTVPAGRCDITSISTTAAGTTHASDVNISAGAYSGGTVDGGSVYITSGDSTISGPAGVVRFAVGNGTNTTGRIMLVVSGITYTMPSAGPIPANGTLLRVASGGGTSSIVLDFS